jgi:hypothetical protein
LKKFREHKMHDSTGRSAYRIRRPSSDGRNYGVPVPAVNIRDYLDKLLTNEGTAIQFDLFGWQYVSSAGFPTPTSLASAARIFFRASA